MSFCSKSFCALQICLTSFHLLPFCLISFCSLQLCLDILLRFILISITVLYNSALSHFAHYTLHGVILLIDILLSFILLRVILCIFFHITTILLNVIPSRVLLLIVNLFSIIPLTVILSSGILVNVTARHLVTVKRDEKSRIFFSKQFCYNVKLDLSTQKKVFLFFFSFEFFRKFLALPSSRLEPLNVW